jgi:hypothetical protein
MDRGVEHPVRLANRYHDERWLELANLDEVFPKYLPVAGFGGVASPPWPTEPVRRLAWLATSNARPWVPDDDELQALWDRVKGKRVVRMPA